MGKIQHHILTLCLVFTSMLASLSACSDSDVPGGGQAGGGDTFSLALDVTIPVMPGSRATYEQGVGDYENTIDLAAKDYRILLFSGDDKLLVEFKNDDVVLTENTPLASNPTYRSYRVTAEVDKSITEYTALKLVVLANWGDYPTLAAGATTIDDLAGYAVSNGAVSTDASTTFNGADHLQNTQGNHIPMFGVKDCQGIAWLKNDLTWFGNLWLLRAVAKIEVRSATESVIESVQLNHYNKLGTCVPKNVRVESDYVIDGSDKYKALDYLTLPGGVNDIAGPVDLLPDEDGAYLVYVPEYQNLVDATTSKINKLDEYAYLTVKFKGIQQSYQIDFKYYTAESALDNGSLIGDFFDIKRNYYYRYILNLSDSKPELIVDVVPYRGVLLNPTFGFDDPTPRPPLEAGETPPWVTIDPSNPSNPDGSVD